MIVTKKHPFKWFIQTHEEFILQLEAKLANKSATQADLALAIRALRNDHVLLSTYRNMLDRALRN